ncbi:MAG: helicase C-terminal domain-containing protein [Myxococcota bacterium]
MTAPRFHPDAAADFRRAVLEAGGVEVFAIGDMDGSVVRAVTIACRGTVDAVPALLERPRSGQVVIHNHPSGNLGPSAADMHLAGLYGDEGVGVVIVNSDVTADNWVVEPHAERHVNVEKEQVERFFSVDLPRIMPGYEARPQQVALALEVMHGLNEERPIVAEAGTGTGKSLAYLVPAALWAMANDSKVVVSTYTRALQSQLLHDDLPVLPRAGLDVRYAVLQGRNNYLCKRRLGLAVSENEGAPDADREPVLADLAQWDQVTEDGSRGDLPVELTPGLWERVESDSDLTLRVRCAFYDSCHYYQARRRAAAAHIVVANHALLMADRSLKQAGAQGVLPKYRRVILDEAHHLEDAATGALAARLTVRALQRATAPLLHRRRRKGAIERISIRHLAGTTSLDEGQQKELEALIGPAVDHTTALREEGPAALEVLGRSLPPTALRVTEALEETPEWRQEYEPPIQRLMSLYQSSIGVLGRMCTVFEDVVLPEADVPPVQELNRARKRLISQRSVLDQVLDADPDRCRWLAQGTGRQKDYATLNAAPVEVAPVLKALLWDSLPGSTATSATLSVNQHFSFWQRRVGLFDVQPKSFPSPFDYATQAVLALPTDLPLPDEQDFFPATCDLITEACRMSHGGTFVLCTSYDAVQRYSAHLREHLPAAWPILAQGKTGRDALLRTFRESRRAVLVGTDAFWEGVSVRGLALRQVIVPRIPFRVPTEPLHEARVEVEQRQGRDPFRSLILPHATLRLRQGFGRLIRSQGDRGVVLLLDRRLHERAYGRPMIRSLPPARPVKGPWRRVQSDLEAYWTMLAAERQWAKRTGARWE